MDADMVLVATQNWQTLVRGFPNFSQFSRIITRVNFKEGAVFADPADPGGLLRRIAVVRSGCDGPGRQRKQDPGGHDSRRHARRQRVGHKNHCANRQGLDGRRRFGD